MSIDCHLKIDGVEGESKHKGHAKEIDLMTWAWSVHNATTAGSGGGSGKGKAMPGEMMITKNYDKSSPVLAKHCVSGKHLDKAVFTFSKSGEGQEDFLSVTLKQVKVDSVAPSASSGGELIEAVSLSYADIEFAYKAQDEKGKLGGEVKFGWNILETTTR